MKFVPLFYVTFYLFGDNLVSDIPFIHVNEIKANDRWIGSSQYIAKNVILNKIPENIAKKLITKSENTFQILSQQS